MKKLLLGLIVVLFCLPAIIYFFPKRVEAWPGCCSHHNGVCGCQCCDGTSLSSTCAPHYPECLKNNYWEVQRARNFAASRVTDYTQNHHRFREKLIAEMKGQFNLSLDKIGWVVYAFLPDIK